MHDPEAAAEIERELDEALAGLTATSVRTKSGNCR
jgi:hypothetical protein